jgi:hypothetical protein
MHKILIAGFVLSGVLACSGSDSGDLAGKGGKGGASATSTLGLLAVGTTVQATIQDSISSRRSKTGAQVHAIVSRNVMDGTGRVVIPGGAAIVLTIATLGAAKGPTDDGIITLDATSITSAGTTYTPSAGVGVVPHALLGRDVIVSPGTPITITLTQPLKIAAN